MVREDGGFTEGMLFVIFFFLHQRDAPQHPPPPASSLNSSPGLKGTLHFFLELGSFYNSPRVKQLSFTVFESIQQVKANS